MRPLLFYLALWLSFGAVHSLLAAASGRAWLARRTGALGCKGADRLAYNLIALGHLAVVLALGHWLLTPLPPALAVHPAWPVRAVQFAALAGGAAILVAGGRSYDLARFSGLAQLRLGVAERDQAPEPLATAGWNARVRHPLYLGLLLLVWGGAWSGFGLITAVCISAYLWVGIRFEERKLLRLYGPAYADYRARVPMLLPRPNRRRGRRAG